jgi:hypothetical protein
MLATAEHPPDDLGVQAVPPPATRVTASMKLSTIPTRCLSRWSDVRTKTEAGFGLRVGRSPTRRQDRARRASRNGSADQLLER